MLILQGAPIEKGSCNRENPPNPEQQQHSFSGE